MTGRGKRIAQGLVVLTCASILGACRYGPVPPATVDGVYPIAYLKRLPEALRPPTAGEAFVPGGDLYLRELADPEAPEHNVTRRLTLGVGDVSGPAVSYDGRRIVFSMRCGPDSELSCASDDTWNLWEYDWVNDLLYRVIEDDYIANLADDLDPAYLPDGRIVFSSDRQSALPERPWLVPGEGRRARLLHVIDPRTQRIEQITFNEADDRHPRVDGGGRIIYARWEKAVHRNQIALYRVLPDGRDNRPLYGSHSPGEVFTRPIPLPDGSLLSLVTSRAAAWGGDLLALDVVRYGDLDDRAPGEPPDGGQRPAGPFPLSLDETPSPYGRIHSADGGWDGSGEVLLAYTPSESPPGEDPEQGEAVAPRYGIYTLDLVQRTLRPLILPQPGVAILEPVALVPRPLPPLPEPPPRLEGVGEDEGQIEVLSVYDTDRLGRMGNGLLSESERARMAIPQIPPMPGEDIRPLVADLARLKDPAQTRAGQRPAWFVRVVQALGVDPDIPADLVGVEGIGPRRIVGYAPLEPDGSVIIRVPADVPLAITVLDHEARAFETHDAWFQVRPGERLVCDGCHDPDRVPPLNRPPVAGGHPNTRLRDWSGRPIPDPDTGGAVRALPGETMAETRLRVDPGAADPSPDPVYRDLWTDPEAAGRPADPERAYRYADLVTPVPQDGLLDYPTHIQPLWDRPRRLDLGDGAREYRCSTCHDGRRDSQRNPTGLDLRAQLAGHSGRMVSYEDLVTGDLVFNAEGRPYFDLIDGQAVPRRAVPLVFPASARRSHLVEILSGEELLAEQPLPQHPIGPDHARLLTPAERRLVNEWIDLGAQYYNRLRESDGSPRKLGPRLSFTTYSRYIHYELLERCAACHRPILRDGRYNPLFTPSQYLLTGDITVDFRNTAAEVDDLANPDASHLIYWPSSISSGHPLLMGGPFIGPDSIDGNAFYQRLVRWIRDAGEGNR